MYLTRYSLIPSIITCSTKLSNTKHCTAFTSLHDCIWYFPTGLYLTLKYTNTTRNFFVVSPARVITFNFLDPNLSCFTLSRTCPAIQLAPEPLSSNVRTLNTSSLGVLNGSMMVGRKAKLSFPTPSVYTFALYTLICR